MGLGGQTFVLWFNQRKASPSLALENVSLHRFREKSGHGWGEELGWEACTKGSIELVLDKNIWLPPALES